MEELRWEQPLETADEIYDKIINEYHPTFLAFRETMQAKRSGEQRKLL